MGRTESPKTTHKAIFEYWKDKAISELGNVYIDYGYEGCDETLLRKVKTVGVVYDWGEPRCFACNRSVGAENEPDYEERLKNSLDGSAVWTYKCVRRLQRCHIKPRLLGGEDKPSNLFLLCERCHKDSPDTIYRRQFFRWVYQRRQKLGYSSLIFNQAIQILKNTYDISIPIFSEKVMDNAYNEVGLHGGTISDSSIVAYLVEDALKNQKRKD